MSITITQTFFIVIHSNDIEAIYLVGEVVNKAKE